MADGGFIPAYGQQHELFHRTAKDLLCFRLANANPESTQEREMQRLEDQFQDQCITLLVRHPTQGVISEDKIPIIPATADDEFPYYSSTMTNYDVLPLSEYELCNVEWQMPGGLKVLHSDIIFEVVAMTGEHMDLSYSICWSGSANSQEMLSGTHMGFIEDFFRDSITFLFNLERAYPALPDGRTFQNTDYEALDHAMPISTQAFYSIEMPSCPSYCSSPFAYLKVMESWTVVARHLRDDATESTRLRSLFQETFLLIDMGPAHEEVGRQVMTTDAFALVSLVDDAGLLDLFTSWSTRLHVVEEVNRPDVNGPEPGLLLPGENHFTRISLLDLKANRVFKLNESYDPSSAEEDLDDEYDFTATCRLACFDREIQFFPSCKVVDGHALTVRLEVNTMDYDVQEEDEDRDEREFASVLEVWKFMELCLTAKEVSWGKSR